MRRIAVATPWLVSALVLIAAASLDGRAQEPAPLRVLVYDAPGVVPAALTSALDALTAAGIEARAVGPEEVRAGALDRGVDAVLFTGGRGSVQGRLLGDDGRARVRRFVERGGGYVGICAGAYLAIQGPAEFHKIGIVAAHNLTGDRWQRGVAPTRVVPNDGSPPRPLHYANGPLLAREDVSGLTPFVVLATFDADVHAAEYGTLPGEMPGQPAVAAASFGRGRIVLFSPNPTLEPAQPELLVRALRWTVARRTPRRGSIAADLRWRDVFGG